MIVCLHGRHTIDTHNQLRPMLRRSAPPRRRELRLPPQAALRNLRPRSLCRSCHNPNNVRMGSFCTFCVFDRPRGSPRRCRSPVGAQPPLACMDISTAQMSHQNPHFSKKRPFRRICGRARGKANTGSGQAGPLELRAKTAMLAPHENSRIFDPCCGSGGMFVQSEEFVEAHGGRRDAVSIFGQESNGAEFLGRRRVAGRPPNTFLSAGAVLGHPGCSRPRTPRKAEGRGARASPLGITKSFCNLTCVHAMVESPHKVGILGWNREACGFSGGIQQSAAPLAFVHAVAPGDHAGLR